MFDVSLILVYGFKLVNWLLLRDSVMFYVINKGFNVICFVLLGIVVIYCVELYFMFI